ncbi:MAG: hypothetical protein LBO09_03905 [Candidatus Peribacteria bacterium]|jgi:hypothetical protein|nr:hypothetical protein [Candidatus Peribacteria bacterium]
MDKLPEALAKRETQGIIRKEKRDKYEQTILNFLAKYENDDLETTYISDLEMIETVEKAFAK